MGPIEEHILLHHKDLVEQDSLHLHLLLHLHKGLVEEHIQAQASGSGGNCVNHVLIIWKDKYWDKFTVNSREKLQVGMGSWNKCSLVYIKFSCVRINIKGLSPCPAPRATRSQRDTLYYFILYIHEVFLCMHQHQRIIPLPQGLHGPSLILYTTLPARLASKANIAEPTATKCLQKWQKEKN